ncbi:MAG: universal stress protein, partial [Planctomycetota bacterium]
MPKFDRVLVPLDFSEVSETVLQYGVELTKAGGTTILLHVLEPLPLHFESAFGTFVN